ncbi:50S ribosomal protein L23 [Candidatus Microgenomates bacterium]|nr:50S ribosomal protein L23 [Candidatus Microgenomates bacterium]
MRAIDVLKRPIITEKSFQEAAKGFYTFEVDRKANKNQIRKAVEDQFEVQVISVKTLNYKGKKRKFGKKKLEVQMPAFKKALVELKKGQKIDIFEVQETAKKE